LRQAGCAWIFDELKAHLPEIAAAVSIIEILGIVALSCGFFTVASAPEIKYVAVNGDKLAYVEVGQGDPGGCKTIASGTCTWLALPIAIVSSRIVGAITIPIQSAMKVRQGSHGDGRYLRSPAAPRAPRPSSARP
jgi:hypothetical protein